jgi:hypothetical protein
LFATNSGGAATAAWGNGIEAVVPANAGVTNQATGIGSISCPSAGNCSAVGFYIDGAGNTEGVLLTETAGTWAPGVEAVLPANAATTGQDVFVGSVSCPSAGECTAVGSYVDASGNTEGLLLTETAGRWSTGVEATLPANAAPQQRAEIRDVSCASAGNCTAVGSFFTGPGISQGLLLTETAGAWTRGVEATLPPDATTNQLVALESVSCASAGNCTAVGTYSAGSGGQGLLLTETAGSWARGSEAVLPADAATTYQNAGLSSVSCSSPGNCTAVGWFDWDRYGGSQLGGKGLLVTETAGGWSAGVEAALPPNAAMTDPLNNLTSVSCPSAGNCTAVGTYYDSLGPQGFLLTETAGSWSTGVEALPESATPLNPALAVGVGLNSVSCPSIGDCSAVGSYLDNSGNLVGLLLTETAGRWATGVEASLPANARRPNPFAALYSASCPATGSCSGAGFYADNSSGHGEDGLLIGGSPPMVTVDISRKGSGAGRVSDGPAGIDCGSTCSASVAAGTSLSPTASSSAGSRFGGWSGGGCSGTGSCRLNTGIGKQTVTARFSLLAKCLVPRLKGRTLKAAEHALRSHNCTVGKIRQSTSRTIRKGRVISQRPRPGSRLKHGARVSLVVSRGRR